MSITLTEDILSSYRNNVFIETGTYLGGAIDLAIKLNFREIHSVDISRKYEISNKEKFKNYPFVNLHYGESFIILDKILENINDKVTFWLDAHYDIFSDVCGLYKCPLLQELNVIKNYTNNYHTILIDDIRMFKSTNEWNISLEDIIKNIKLINKNYKILFVDGKDDDKFRKDDILIATL